MNGGYTYGYEDSSAAIPGKVKAALGIAGLILGHRGLIGAKRALMTHRFRKAGAHALSKSTKMDILKNLPGDPNIKLWLQKKVV
jgi:hypothetical protein